MFVLARKDGTPYTLLPLFDTAEAAWEFARWELTWLPGTYTVVDAPVAMYTVVSA